MSRSTGLLAGLCVLATIGVAAWVVLSGLAGEDAREGRAGADAARPAHDPPFEARPIEAPGPATVATSPATVLREPSAVAKPPRVEQSASTDDAASERFEAKYAHRTRTELLQSLRDVSNAFDAQRDAAFEEQKRSGGHVEGSMPMDGDGFVPKLRPEPASKGALTMTILNPVEKLTSAQGFITVWSLQLARETHPALFDLQDERDWLKEAVRRSDLGASDAK